VWTEIQLTQKSVRLQAVEHGNKTLGSIEAGAENSSLWQGKRDQKKSKEV